MNATHHREHQLVRVQTDDAEKFDYVPVVQLREDLNFTIEIVQELLVVERFVLDHFDSHQRCFVAVLWLIFAFEDFTEKAFADLFAHLDALVRQLVLFDGRVQQEEALQRAVRIR